VIADTASCEEDDYAGQLSFNAAKILNKRMSIKLKKEKLEADAEK
jgi:hypothetical protein